MMRSDHDYDNNFDYDTNSNNLDLNDCNDYGCNDNNFDDDTKSNNNSNSKVVGWSNNQCNLVQ